MKKLSNEDITNIIKLYQSGQTPAQIGKEFEIMPGSVVRIIRNSGIERTQCVKTGQDQINEIIKRYSDGESSEKIAKDLGINGTTVCRILKRNGASIRPATENKKKYNKNDSYFKQIDSIYKSYFLGLMLSDGNVSSKGNTIKISLLNKDRKILSLFSNQIFGFEKLDFEDSGDPEHDTCLFHWYSDEMKQDLIKLGCVPNKTFKITFTEYPFMSHFLRGYLDGDGCISVSDSRCRVIYTCNAEFGAGLQRFLQDKLEIKSSISKYSKSAVVDVTINNIDDCVKFLNYIYADCEDFYMDRKYEKYQQVLEFKKGKESKIHE